MGISRRKTPRGTRGTCKSGKVRYLNRALAQQALAKLRRMDSLSHTENRVYDCPFCAGFHLTSKS